jgi:hypothetical protein
VFLERRTTFSAVSVGLVAIVAATMFTMPGARAGQLAAETPSGTVPGVYYRYYESNGTSVAEITGPIVKQGVSNLASGSEVYPPPGDPPTPGTNTNQSFDLTPRNRNDNIGFIWTGYINIPAGDSGTWTFYTNSDDGSKVFIGPGLQQVVDNDGSHGWQERSGTIDLAEGLHTIMVMFKNGTGNFNIGVAWELPTVVAKAAIPNTALFTEPTLAATPVITGNPTNTLGPNTVTITCA